MTIVSSLFGAITPDETVNSLFSIDTTPQETQSTEKPKEVKKKEEKKEKSTEKPEGKVGKKKAEKKDKKEKKEVKEEEEKKEDSVEITHDGSSDEETPKSNGTETRREKIQKIIEKNERTVFVGNLPITVIEKEPTKDLQKLFSQFGKLESIRFRSIAFSEKLPRKQAFIAKKLHEKRESLNAYIVFKESEAAKKALSLNGTVFMDHHIRVDIAEKKQEKQRDSKRCVFIGNLPFDIADEQVWGFFEGVGEIENVRLIRDRKTNVGKGFGYVQFKERASVVLALKLNDNELEGRKLRVTRAVESLADKSEKATKVVEGTRAKRDHGIKLKTKPKVGKKKAAPGQVKKTRAQVLAKKIGKAVRTGKKL
ncbi:Nucleolar protein 12 [Boothiomyces macroporosus]|uniref:Nucleolar protein 12 n=1 Tax=Boothiomyces macroporosus TaxID=261099 RepID=A0AAD5US91_9FUNG|nr:Nucleolar protein 12 [Boothiomyces macroporosus]